MISTEWVDEYKSEYSHNVIELLLSISVREEIVKDNKLLLKIADIILMHDCTDEDAIRIKCRALFLSGTKKDLLNNVLISIVLIITVY